VRQLNDEPKLVIKWDLLERRKATTREAQQSLEIGSLLLR
jgi:hypothetical protein